MRGGSSARGIIRKAMGTDPAPNWVTLDFRQDPRGRWSGQGELVDTVRYMDPTETPQPWPWVPRYWRASDLPELQVDAPADQHRSSTKTIKAKRARAGQQRAPTAPQCAHSR